MSTMEEAFEAQAKTLREFGYPDVTADTVRHHYEAWKRGDTVKDVIFRFNEDAFGRHPSIFGRPDE